MARSRAPTASSEGFPDAYCARGLRSDEHAYHQVSRQADHSDQQRIGYLGLDVIDMIRGRAGGRENGGVGKGRTVIAEHPPPATAATVAYTSTSSVSPV